MLSKKLRFGKFEIQRDLPSGTAIGASECRGGALYKHPK